MQEYILKHKYILNCERYLIVLNLKWSETLIKDEIAAKIGCDWVMYQDLDALEASVKQCASPDTPLTKLRMFSFILEIEI